MKKTKKTLFVTVLCIAMLASLTLPASARPLMQSPPVAVEVPPSDPIDESVDTPARPGGDTSESEFGLGEIEVEPTFALTIHCLDWNGNIVASPSEVGLTAGTRFWSPVQMSGYRITTHAICTNADPDASWDVTLDGSTLTGTMPYGDVHVFVFYAPIRVMPSCITHPTGELRLP